MRLMRCFHDTQNWFQPETGTISRIKKELIIIGTKLMRLIITIMMDVMITNESR